MVFFLHKKKPLKYRFRTYDNKMFDKPSMTEKVFYFVCKVFGTGIMRSGTIELILSTASEGY